MATQALARSGNSSITGPIALGSFLCSECSPDPPHASFGNFFSRREGGVGVSPSSPSPLLLLLGLNFFPWHFTGSQSKRPDLQRGESQAAPPLLLPAQNWNLKRVRGEEAKQEELGFL